MSEYRYLITAKSKNAKVGPLMVTTSPKQSCPSTCPMKGNGCYADCGPLAGLWRGLTATDAGDTFANGKGKVTVQGLPELLAAIEALKDGAAWRHNQAGDLEHTEGTIDLAWLRDITAANTGKRGWTYTHHDVERNQYNRNAVRTANALGFTVNLSANSLAHADKLADLDCGPVVTILPADQLTNTETPAGRKVVVCPAVTRDDVNCASCLLCQKAKHTSIVGFPAHGASKRKVSAIASK